ncbi:MAG: c-type cytochrome, partial [Chitinophagales bacterium]
MQKFLQVGLIVTLLFAFVAAVYLLYSLEKKNDINVTYADQIAPIIYQHCSNCHRPGEAGPFPLLTYHDVAKRSLTIREIVDKKIMPPWPADPSYSHFCDENYLSKDEIALVDKWVQFGAPLGDASKVPPIPKFPDHSLIGKPDLTLHIKPFAVQGNSTDRFMVMKIPFELPQDSFIRAIEFVPSCKYIHHVNGHLICFDDEKK